MDSYLIILRDITEEYEARQETEKQMAISRQESQSKTDFLSKMSHEIRTPMNGILGMLNLVRAHMDQKKEAEEYLNKTEELSQFLLNLINDILDISRIESGRMQLEQETFDLYGLADKLDAMFQSTAQAKGIHWKVELLDVRDRGRDASDDPGKRYRKGNQRKFYQQDLPPVRVGRCFDCP